jgi:signal transduction histidine kinase/CheY-like chemotaxis protein
MSDAIEAARHAALIESLTVGLLLESEARAVLRANRAFCDIFRLPFGPEALTGADCDEMARASAGAFRDPVAFLARIDAIVAAREIVRADLLDLADGRTLERDFVPLRDGDLYLGHYWQYRDVTAREADRRALEAARDEAERASRVKSEFLARMSHEIRTPIAAVVGFADVLLRSGAAEGSGVEYIRQIRRNADHLLALLDDMLDLSQIESGRLRVRSEPVAPEAILAAVDSLLRPIAAQRGLSLAFTFDTPTPAWVCTDALRLRQILVNLGNNALKFTDQGGVTVRARLERAPSPRLVIDVVDTGVGIAADQIPRLFTAFTQVHDLSGRPGTGLGLAISRRLAHALGGELAVTSQPGRGSTFTLSLPVSDVECADLAESPSIVPPLPPTVRNDGQRYPLAGLRVLVADDSDDLQRVVVLFLEHAGATVECVRDGRGCLDRLAVGGGAPFDAVLLDMQMPVLDGYETAAALRRRGDDTPIVAFTAYAMSGDAERCLAVGCDAYLAKPVDPDRLVAALIELTARPLASGVAALRETLADETMRDLVATFAAQLPRREAEFAAAFAAGDLAAARGIAHNLRGTAESYGFPEVTARATEVDESLRRGDVASVARPAVESLRAALRRACAAARNAGL